MSVINSPFSSSSSSKTENQNTGPINNLLKGGEHKDRLEELYLKKKKKMDEIKISASSSVERML